MGPVPTAWRATVPPTRDPRHSCAKQDHSQNRPKPKSSMWNV
jgi:hypothetical protein